MSYSIERFLRFRYDYETIKYTFGGVKEWAARYNGSGNGDDIANAVAVDTGGNVYVTGDIYANGNSNYATVKYNQDTEINVTIDIKPGSYPNSINVKSNGVIPVAILGSVAFDVNTVDPLSVKLGPITTETGATEIHK